MSKQVETPPYHPSARGFWEPNTRKRLKQDTAETLMEVQDYKPPRKNRVHPENLPSGQWNRERSFTEGQYARRHGQPRDSSPYHHLEPEKRTASTDQARAAFELGWDTVAGVRP